MNTREARWRALMQELGVLERKARALEQMTERVRKDADRIVADYKATAAILRRELEEVKL